MRYRQIYRTIPVYRMRLRETEKLELTGHIIKEKKRKEVRGSSEFAEKLAVIFKTKESHSAILVLKCPLNALLPKIPYTVISVCGKVSSVSQRQRKVISRFRCNNAGCHIATYMRLDRFTYPISE